MCEFYSEQDWKLEKMIIIIIWEATHFGRNDVGTCLTTHMNAKRQQYSIIMKKWP